MPGALTRPAFKPQEIGSWVVRLVRVEIPTLKKVKAEGVKLPSRVEQIAREVRDLLKDIRKA